MLVPILLASLSAGCFLALAHAAVTAPGPLFRKVTAMMAASAGVLVVVAPAAGVSLLAPVLLARRLAVPATVPATVEELLKRRP